MLSPTSEPIRRAHQYADISLCPHFVMSRADLFEIVRIKKLKDFRTIMDTVGVGRQSQGCETCKPVIASILSALYNEHVMKPSHHGNQDTNDKSVAPPIRMMTDVQVHGQHPARWDVQCDP